MMMQCRRDLGKTVYRAQINVKKYEVNDAKRQNESDEGTGFYFK